MFFLSILQAGYNAIGVFNDTEERVVISDWTHLEDDQSIPNHDVFRVSQHWEKKNSAWTDRTGQETTKTSRKTNQLESMPSGRQSLMTFSPSPTIKTKKKRKSWWNKQRLWVSESPGVFVCHGYTLDGHFYCAINKNWKKHSRKDYEIKNECFVFRSMCNRKDCFELFSISSRKRAPGNRSVSTLSAYIHSTSRRERSKDGGELTRL